MHEMSLAESVLEIIQESARTQNFQRVRTVTLEIGKLAAVEPDAMRFCFDSVMQNTLAEGAELQIIESPGKGICLACCMNLELQDSYGLCPTCGSHQLKITSGKQMRVINLDVE